MKLKKLEIIGFKSFRDKTTVDFSEGISAIVGPNGCGKSNIVDTIRWIMGEQSAKLLRGKRMEDVIFNGSDDAPAVNMAEVSIILAGDGQGFPGNYAECSEVMVTRRVFRDADSEYYINKVPCRLLDVREFFMDTGVGARTYSLVEQNSISNMIEAKPEDRRLFIEEAAGIRKYKSRREAAARKMEATQQNILRLNDIIREVKSQLNSISKQARRAERYKVLKKELREAEVTLALQNYSLLIEKRAALAQTADALSDREVEIRTRIRAIEAEIAALRTEVAENEGILHRLQEKAYALKNNIGFKEQGIEFSRGKISDLAQRKGKDMAEIEILHGRRESTTQEIQTLEAQIGQLEKQIAEIKDVIFVRQQGIGDLREAERACHEEMETKKNAHVEILTENARLRNMRISFDKEIEGLRKRAEREDKDLTENASKLQNIRESLAGLQSTVQSQEANFASLHVKERDIHLNIENWEHNLSACEEKIAQLKEDTSVKSSRLLSLKEFQDGYLWCNEATRSIMKDRDQVLAFDTVHGLVADHIEVPREFEVAVEAVLGEKLQYVVVKSQEDGVKAIDYLKTHSTGRGSFIPLEVRSHAGEASPEYLNETVRLSDRVKIREDFRSIADYLLGDVLLIPNLNTGISLWKRNGFSGTFVTPDGDIITAGGVLIGGNGSNGDSGLLRNKREIVELEADIRHNRDILNEEKELKEELGRMISVAEDSADRLRKEQHALELAVHSGKKDMESFENEIRWVEQRINVLRFNRETLAAEETQAVERIAAIEKEITANEARSAQDSETMASLRANWEKSRNDLDALEKELTGEMISLKSLEEKKSACGDTLERLRLSAEHLKNELNAKTSDIESCDQEVSQLTLSIEQEEGSLKVLYEDYRQTEQELTAKAALQREKEDFLKTKEAEDREARKDLDLSTSAVNELQMELQGHLFQMEALKRSVLEKYAADIDNTIGGFIRMDESQIAELSEKASRNNKAVEEFGEVNLLAINEHDSLKERYDFLTAQVADLNSSLEALQQTIQRINRISRTRFAETFEAVNSCFKEVFPKLFPGGRAELRLTDESDLLETGVDIDIRVPGKKTQNVMLLSGGEKALSAVALIFGIILFRPAPFLILDEADAALDDTNVSLFNNLLRDVAKHSQIILITHNKKTMEVADSLYGVTMEKSGISTLVSVSLH